MKKVIPLVLIFIALFSCDNAPTHSELGKNEIVSVIYADFNDNMYEFWAETIDFINSDKKDNINSSITHVMDTTPQKAWSTLLYSFKNEPYFGHCNAIVLQSGFYEKSPSELFDFLISSSQLSLTTATYMTDYAPSEFKKNEIFDYTNSKLLPIVPLYTLFFDDKYTFDIPNIDINNNNIFCSGGDMFIDNKFDFYMNYEDYFIYNILKNKNYNLPLDNIIPLKSKCVTQNKNGVLNVSYKILIKDIYSQTKNETKEILEKHTSDFIIKMNNRKSYLLQDNKEWTNFKVEIDVAQDNFNKTKE